MSTDSNTDAVFKALETEIEVEAHPAEPEPEPDPEPLPEPPPEPPLPLPGRDPVGTDEPLTVGGAWPDVPPDAYGDERPAGTPMGPAGLIPGPRTSPGGWRVGSTGSGGTCCCRPRS